MSKSQIFLIVIYFFNSIFCFAQNEDSSLSFISESKSSAIYSYEKLIEDQSGINNGVEYVDYDIKINGHPFFEEEDFLDGTVEYNKEIYHSVPLKYDVIKDLLIVEYYDHIGYGKDLSLNHKKIGYFIIDGNYFVKVDEIKPVGNLEEGFYNLVLNDLVQVYIKRRKELLEEIIDMKINKDFIEKDKYFIIKDGNSHEVKSMRAILKVFDDQKSELKKYIKNNTLDFRHYFEFSLLSITEEYLKLKRANEIF